MGTIEGKRAGGLMALATTVVLAASLGGCSGGGRDYVQTAPGAIVSHQALADDVYLDGTGPTARRLARSGDGMEAERIQVAPPSGGPSHAVARSRPTAIPRADDISASTTGTRSSAQAAADKPFSDQWWEKERAEDARLRSRMNICRGC